MKWSNTYIEIQNMPKIDARILSQGVIRYNEFSQKVYIKSNGWMNENPALRAGAWVGNRVDPVTGKIKYGSGGTCVPLSMVYLMSSNWGQFISYIDTPMGKALIRGIKNAQLMSQSLDMAGTGIFREFLNDTMSKVGLNLDKTFKPYRNSDRQRLAGRIYDCMRFESHGMISIASEGASHAMSAKIESGMMKFFDPNKGEFWVPFDRNNRTVIERFLTQFLAICYPRFEQVDIKTYINGTLV